jgi:hypothetical protein
MTGKAKEKSENVLEVHDLSMLKGNLKPIGGSMSDDWNNMVANQAVLTRWCFGNEGPNDTKRYQRGTVEALIGINPKDEIEGMIGAQLIACHNASMECHRRAMLRDQTFEGRREALNQANKLSRTYATLVESLNRHRGKGQQKVTVEHVHVHEGGQAIVGTSRARGRHRNQRNNPMHLDMHQAKRCRARTRHGPECQSP